MSGTAVFHPTPQEIGQVKNDIQHRRLEHVYAFFFRQPELTPAQEQDLAQIVERYYSPQLARVVARGRPSLLTDVLVELALAGRVQEASQLSESMAEASLTAAVADLLQANAAGVLSDSKLLSLVRRLAPELARRDLQDYWAETGQEPPNTAAYDKLYMALTR